MRSKPQVIGHRRWLVALVVGLALAAGCRQHPRVTSREAQDLIKQVYTACNTRNSDRLARCHEAYNKLVADGLLSDSEKESFSRILSTADQGDWAAAQSASLQFARDQVR